MRLDITCTTTETNHNSLRLIAFMDGDKLSLNNQVGARQVAFGSWHFCAGMLAVWMFTFFNSPARAFVKAA